MQETFGEDGSDTGTADFPPREFVDDDADRFGNSRMLAGRRCFTSVYAAFCDFGSPRNDGFVFTVREYLCDPELEVGF